MLNWKEVVSSYIAERLGQVEEIWSRKTRYCGIVRVVSTESINGCNDWVVKVVMPEQADAAVQFNEASKVFRRELASVEVPLSAVYEMTLRGKYAVQLSSYEGVDCDQVITQDFGQAPTVVRAILTSIKGLLSQPQPSNVGMDSQLSNFCWNNGRPVYTDTFPPLCFYRGQRLVHYPNPTSPEEIEREVGRKFTALGILRRLRFSLLALSPSLGVVFEQALEVLDDDLQVQMREFIATIPNGNIHGMARSELLALIDGLSHDDVETRREIAALVIPETLPNRSELLREIFVCTSLVPLPDQPPLEARLKTFRQIVEEHAH